MPTLKFSGRRDPEAEPPAFASRVRGAKITPKSSAALYASRGEQDTIKVAVADRDCIELELSGGVRLWVPADLYEQDFGSSSARDAGDGSLVVPAALPIGRRSRGDADIVITGLKTFGIDIPGKITDYVATHVERDMPERGDLFVCSTTSAAGLTRATKKISGRGPILVFIHGTASSTEGSFGGLWEAVGANRILRLVNPGARINELFESYNGRILALQHRSLTESPVVNALALAKRLADIADDEAELHLVSHSRGGMIGELLARSMRRNSVPFDKIDLAPFAKRPEREPLQELGRVLQEKRFRITRFVRVACPAAGTTLADGRLDRYFSMLVNVAGKISGLAANPAYDALTSVLAAVLKERTDPAKLPGLEAMMPTSPLARMLNRRDVVTDADLHVLGGDLAMSGFWSTLKALATDFYYREDHDLVVHTRSMLGGAQRSGGIKYWIDTGGEVTHFNYFHRGDTASRLRDALLGEKADDFHALKAKPSEVSADDYRKRAPEDMPVVFLVPDFMGNHLSAADRVWANGERLARGGFGLLANGGVRVDDLAATYLGIVRHLAQTNEVVALPYDWRKSIAVAADLLADRIAKKQKQTAKTGMPIRILAHGAGGLVVRYMIGSKTGRQVWTDMCGHPEARALLLGMPTRGSHVAAATLLGRSALSQGLAAIDLTQSESRLLGILASFDGLLELLPQDGAENWFSPEWWDTLKAADKAVGNRPDWKAPDKNKLGDARDVRKALASVPLDPARIIYVAGTADVTPNAIAVDGSSVTVRGTAYGDGRVTWASGIPGELAASTYYMDAPHGAMASTAQFFPALAELLGAGQTTRLPQKPPARSTARDAALPVPDRPLTHIPNDDELVGFALGYTVRDETTARPMVTVRVVHENLSRAKSPVLVGHYQDDVFVNAEAYLDGQLGGRLRELHRLEAYPGPIGTAEVVSNTFEDAPTGVHPGAVVVGLGTAGELTPGKLLNTIENGLIQYGLARLGQERRRRQSGLEGSIAKGDRVESAITALLVGSGQGGVPLSAALRSLLRAVVSANERFAAAARDQPQTDGRALRAFISAVDIFELFEDRAIETLHALNRLAETAEFRDSVRMEPCLVSGDEGRLRASFEEPAGWWQRVRITETAAPSSPDPQARALMFEPLTERAGFGAYIVEGHRQFADAFIRRAMATTAMDPSVGHTLFQMLVPIEMKEGSADRRSLVLLLDEQAATIPWELLHDRFDPRTRPVAVEGGMVRQLATARDGRERINRSPRPTALVVGDPPLKDPKFPPLAGAAQEAKAVAELLGGHYSVSPLIQEQAQPDAIVAALHQQPWQILHLACHGVFQYRATPDAPPATGVVLGDGVYLQPGDINQMWFVPDLVFLNCCHLGNVRGDAEREPLRYSHLAANIATQFIRMGVRAVVAAGWAVDDKAARAFAESFYGQMLEGVPFGEAVHGARDEIYRQFTGNTWGAYQCYGDPAFSLRVTRPSTSSSHFVTSRELSIAVDSIAIQARAADGTGFEPLLRALSGLVQGAQRTWLDEAIVCGALGGAYAELREFDDAIRYYDKVGTTEKATASLKTLEQLANLKSRYAEIVGRTDAKRAERLFREAQKMLDGLIEIGATAERWSLVGSLHKRRAMVATKSDVREGALSRMVDGYGKAYAIKRDGRQRDPWYPLTNLVAGEIAQSWQVGAKSKQRRAAASALAASIGEHLDLLNGYAQEIGAGATDFWPLAFLADAQLMTALAKRELDSKRRAQLAEAYANARRRGASAKELDSVASQLRFLEKMAAASVDAVVRAMGTQLGALHPEIVRR